MKHRFPVSLRSFLSEEEVRPGAHYNYEFVLARDETKSKYAASVCRHFVTADRRLNAQLTHLSHVAWAVYDI